jgi:hypothetical protein
LEGDFSGELAEIRRLHRSEGVPVKAIVRRLGVAWDSVRSALTSEQPRSYQRPSRDSLVDAVEPEIRKWLRVDTLMPAAVSTPPSLRHGDVQQAVGHALERTQHRGRAMISIV